MLKQSPSRNQRSKGFKVKHALQICLLLAIGVWLLYQVKHSYYKKVALEESSGKNQEKVQHEHEILKLGRKNLNPLVEEATAENLKRGDEEEELEQEDEESKPEENEDEGRGVGDDETDGQEQDRSEEEEPEQLEDLIDEEDKENELGSEGTENLEEEDRIDVGGSLNNHDHSGIVMNSEKAQEDHYKGDDAASAVVQNTQIVTSESENGVLRAVKEEEHVKNVARNEVEMENKTYSEGEVNDLNLKVGEGEETNKIQSVNSMGSGEKVGEFSLNILDGGTHYNSSMKVKLNEQQELNNSMVVQVEIQGQNMTSDGKHSNIQTVVLEQNAYLNETAKDEQSHFSATLSLKGNSDAAGRELEDSFGESESSVRERIVMFDEAPITKESSASITTTENADAIQSEDLNANAKVGETSELSTTNVTAENVQNELIDSSGSSLYQEDKEDHIALEALLETNVGRE
uniref:Putative midasin-like n=1 Tax=Davidia involucrata TaxID=16924 RepID=A0A5B7B8D2_DAVIN